MEYVNGKAGAGAGTPAPGMPMGTNPSAATSTTPNLTTAGGFAFQFRKAVKYDAKLRMAISGPGGSGKTYTALQVATGLGGPIALLDSEHRSAEKYADLFDFAITETESYDPDIIPALIDAAAAAGFSTLIIDSWSHFWMGAGGELEQVDSITSRTKSNNSFAAWRHVSPKHTRMIDAILSSPIHIIVTMRVKTEWVLDQNERGKTVPRKVGMAPVMRDGVEYEFDICGDMDQENNFLVTKSRCPRLTNKYLEKPGREVALILKEWLNSPIGRAQPAPAPAPTPLPASVAAPINTGNYPVGTQAAADYVAQQKIETRNPATSKPWTTFGEMKRVFARLREIVGDYAYLTELERYGWRSVGDIKSTEKAIECYHHLEFLAQKVAQEEGR